MEDKKKRLKAAGWLARALRFPNTKKRIDRAMYKMSKSQSSSGSTSKGGY